MNGQCVGSMRCRRELINIAAVRYFNKAGKQLEYLNANLSSKALTDTP